MSMHGSDQTKMVATRQGREPEASPAQTQSWLQANVVQPVKDVVTQGITPAKLAMSFSAGVCGGVFPIPGMTTPVTVLLAWLFAANVVVASVLNLLLTPVNFATVLPFMYFGCSVMSVEPVPLSVQVLTDDLKTDLQGTLAKYGAQIGYGVVGWTAVLPFLAGAAYALSFYTGLTAKICEAYKSVSGETAADARSFTGKDS